MEVCKIIIDECGQKRIYQSFFGILGRRLCSLYAKYIKCFEKAFQDQYEIVHHLENDKLKNVSKFFADLLITNSIRWSVCIYF